MDMRIRIPRWYDRVLDKIATWVFPPNKPIGLQIFKYDITWLDLTLIGYTLLMAFGVAWLLGSWIWIPITIGCMIGAGIWMYK